VTQAVEARAAAVRAAAAKRRFMQAGSGKGDACCSHTACSGSRYKTDSCMNSA
jgi:hypothetical protein